jgi:D-alanyl-D-alanine carboxypeptidase
VYQCVRSRFSSSPLTTLLLSLVLLVTGFSPANANSKYAAIVMDANSGKTLYAQNADSPRYPASLTKMMTLYMMFEAMASGRISRDTRIPFSRNAAAEPPTKLGVRAGGSITVETAIRALVARSANDVATAVAEFLGGSEAEFARRMTAKARQLGMASTTFRNAHGLPDSAQQTTARDMARLGIALREHFPQYYDYFSTRSFSYAGRAIRSHNRLLGSIKGVDGIKTGYIRASGFNLVTSVRTDGRQLVAVVMGGQSGRSRDAHMAELIRRHLPKASRKAGGPLVAGRTTAAPGLPMRNIPVPEARPVDQATAAVALAFAAAEGVQGAAETALARQPAPRPAAATAVEAVPAPAERPEAEAVDPLNTASTVAAPSGWAIQVASLPSETEARAFLDRTAEKAPQVLASASPFTEVFHHEGTTYYRARFTGFSSKDDAWSACQQLKKRRIACYAVRQ